MLFETTRTPLVLPGLYTDPLLFIVQLCDDEYQSIFDTEKSTIKKIVKLLLVDRITGTMKDGALV